MPPESKMRPSPSCVCRRVSALMMEMIATSFFFVYCVSNFEFEFYFQGGLDKAHHKSYNTTPAEERMQCISLLRPHSLTMLFAPRWPHSFRCFLLNRPHAAIDMFLLSFLFFSSLPADEFSEHFRTSKRWPHIIFSDTDLTTFLTIVTSRVHGDKMSGEYEKAVFA